jgi:hypothetical protein
MANKMTWEEMKKNYPDEWLLIVDYDLDESGHLKNGIVERHSKIKNEVYNPPAINKSAAFRYTGESTFSGLRNHGSH